ncbi:MAG: polysaccharide biosynthesis/export family protein [Opitutales bacterium]|nr:polysaccharide biosynthesis/export family protein [Opitutales bacterium]
MNDNNPHHHPTDRSLPSANHKQNTAFDSVQFGFAIVRHWPWIVLAVIIAAGAAVYMGKILWSTGYIATSQLIRYETPDPEIFQPRGIASATLSSIMNATEVHTRTGTHVIPAMPAKELAKVLRVSPERNSDIINVSVAHPDVDTAVVLANAYAEEAARFTRELQAIEASEAAFYLDRQQSEIRSEIAAIEGRLHSAAPDSIAAAKATRPTALLERLDDARDRQLELMGRYTDAHPLVQEQRARVEVLEQQLELIAEDRRGSESGFEANIEVLQEILASLENQRVILSGRQQLARSLKENPPGYVRLFSAATEEHAIPTWPFAKIGLLAMASSLVGLGMMVALIAAIEAFDRRLKTPGDVQRVTQLPILATVGRLDRMSKIARERWAFRSWIALQDRLSSAPNSGLVCGFTSSLEDEGRSIWVKNLAEAANRCGFRVLNITSRPSSTSQDTSPANNPRLLYSAGFWDIKHDEKSAKASHAASSEELVTTGNGKGGDALNANALTAPEEITQRLESSDGPPLVYIPLPGWVWNLQRRKEWKAALKHWGKMDNLVILVELPPASSPETVLLAQNLPNLVWLTDLTRASAPETTRQLDTLRQARCNLVGAVVNRAPKEDTHHRFSRWLPRQAAVIALMAMLTLLGGAVTGTAQTESQPRPAGFSSSASSERADWQKRLTLGPGDVMRLGLYGEPGLTREEATVQPDGRISFLEVHDLMASGLTVDELREQLDSSLSNFRRSPRTMVTPLEFRSKKYYMLGKVVQKGAFVINRPISVVEAVALARGFETGMAGRNVVELVDLSRSFLVRDGERMDVNFEELFASGNLEHNIAIAPGDYMYFPPADMDEIHLLGAVGEPGAVTYTRGLTATRAIASAGGFTQRAWRQRIAVVRGSLEDPQVMTVNVANVLSGKESDVELHPADIVYVSERPWIRAEELLDEVGRAFVQSVIVFWTSDDLFPPVR